MSRSGLPPDVSKPGGAKPGDPICTINTEAGIVLPVVVASPETGTTHRIALCGDHAGIGIKDSHRRLCFGEGEFVFDSATSDRRSINRECTPGLKSRSAGGGRADRVPQRRPDSPAVNGLTATDVAKHVLDSERILNP